jgi:cyclic beta-1,2-glucan synthetase
MWALMAFAILGDGDRAGELLALLNPINHSSSRTRTHRYKVEPYVVAGDVYSVAPHAGRGGWTWYTGAAGWMYRASLESVLGFKLKGDRLRVEPCIPRSWREFEITYRHRTATYLIKVENPEAVCRGVGVIELDGVRLDVSDISLADDGCTHQIRVVLSGREQPQAELSLQPVGSSEQAGDLTNN